MMNKFLPEYLEDICKAGAASAEALKEVCKKLDLILDAIYGEDPEIDETDNEEEPDEVRDTAVSTENNEDLVVPDITLPEILPAKQVKLPNEDNEEPTQNDNVPNDKPIAEKKKRGRQPKK